MTVAADLARDAATPAPDIAIDVKGLSKSFGGRKVVRNLSERAREDLAEEIEVLGAVRLRMVEEAQAKIVQVIRALEDSGQVEIQRGTEDDEFVA